jgi:hypothetical protein
MRPFFRPRSLRPGSRRELPNQPIETRRLQRQRLQVRLGAFLVQGDGTLAVLAAAVVALALIALSLR